jgi:hypothetical protein
VFLIQSHPTDLPVWYRWTGNIDRFISNINRFSMLASLKFEFVPVFDQYYRFSRILRKQVVTNTTLHETCVHSSMPIYSSVPKPMNIRLYSSVWAKHRRIYGPSSLTLIGPIYSAAAPCHRRIYVAYIHRWHGRIDKYRGSRVDRYNPPIFILTDIGGIDSFHIPSFEQPPRFSFESRSWHRCHRRRPHRCHGLWQWFRVGVVTRSRERW